MPLVVPLLLGIASAQQPEAAEPVRPRLPWEAAHLAGQDPWRDPATQAPPVEFGMAFDFFAAFTEKDGSDDAFNELRVRSARAHLGAPLDPHTAVWALLDWGDHGDGGEFLLREAALRVDRLPLPVWPERFHLLVGQYYVDLGPWNTLLPGEFLAPQYDGFRRLYLGGNLSARGVEAHHLIPLRQGRLRWSAGLASELEGHPLDANEFGVPTAAGTASFGRTGLRNWSATGRVEGVWRRGGGDALRAGISGLHSPGAVLLTEVPGYGVIRDEEPRTLAGVDLGWRRETGPDRAHELVLELWADDSSYRTGVPSALTEETETGQSIHYFYQHDARWSGGALMSLFEQPSPGADLDAHYHALWAGYRISPANSVRLFFTHTNPAPYEQKWYTLGVEWTVEFGSVRRRAPSGLE